jgi:2-polyprenyl-3-methyl-5-hydroxy-6-metoxy-1,4-benzoquinol methylase
VREDDSILDIGCGPGTFLRKMRRYGYKKLAGMDIDDRAFRERAPDDIAFIKESITSNSHSDNENLYDVVFVQSMLHHLRRDEYEPAIANIVRMTKKGGKLFVYEPNIKSWCGHFFYYYFLRIFGRIYTEAMYEEKEHILLCDMWNDVLASLGKKGMKCLYRSDWSFYKAFIFVKN